MQSGNGTTSSPSSIPIGEIVLKPNSTTEEKLNALSILVPKAENAKNRIVDLHGKTVANIESSLSYIEKIKRLHSYADTFFGTFRSQITGVGQLVDSLMTYRPHIEQLEKQLEDERVMLDQFTLALNQLRSTTVDQRLQSQILPELPEEEQSNTLADWANQEQLLTTFRLLVEDRESMMSVAEWGIKQMLKMRDKHRILVDELTVCSDLIVAVQKVELGTLTAELEQLKTSASSILSECTTHYDLGVSAMQRRDVSTVTQLAAGDLNLAVLLMSMSKCRSRAANIFGDLSSLSPQWDALESRMKLLEDETSNVLTEARSLVGEYEELDRDISGYLRPDGDVGQYADLVTSTTAWTEFVSMFDLYLEELERRRHAFQRRAAEAEAFRRKIEEDAAEEARARERFDQIFNRPQVPALWRTGEFLNEPSIPLEIIPTDPRSILPDFAEYRQMREIARSEAVRRAEAQLQPKLADRFVIPPPVESNDPEMAAIQHGMAGTQLEQFNHPAFSPPAVALDNSYAQSHAQYSASPSLRAPEIQLRDSGNSLLASDVSITESMLADSNALFHSATDQSAAGHR